MVQICRLHLVSLLLCVVILFVGCGPAPKPVNDKATANDENAIIRSKSATKPTAIELLRKAEALAANGDYVSAGRHLRELLIVEPGNSRGKFLLAQTQSQLGDVNAAIETLNSIPIDDPQFGLAAAGQTADWLSELGEIGDARTTYRKLLSQYPDVPMVRHRFAKFLNILGWRREACEVLKPLVIEGTATEDELRGMLNLSETYASLQIRTSENQDIFERSGMLSMALGRLLDGKARMAVKLLEPFVEGPEMDPEIVAVMAASLAESQQFSRLEVLLSDAPESVKESPYYWRALGDYFALSSKNEEAIGAYLYSIRFDSTSITVHDRLATLLSKTGRHADAEKVNRRGKRLSYLKGAGKSVKRGAPDDLRAGLDLVADLEVLGFPLQAAAWLQHVSTRHAIGVQYDNVPTELKRLRNISQKEQLDARLAGISVQRYPPPIIDFGSPAKQSNKHKVQDSRDDVIAIPRLRNVAYERGLRFVLHNSPEPKERYFQLHQGLGSGVAAFDFDLDGWCDFYLGQQSGSPPDSLGTLPNVLYRQQDGFFVSVQEIAGVDDLGYAMAVTAGDLNQDGFPELIVGNFGENICYINQGDGTFTRSDGIPFDSHSFTTGLAIADVTNDKLPDVVEVNYVNDPAVLDPVVISRRDYAKDLPSPLNFRPARDCVWASSESGLDLVQISLGEQAENVGTGLGLIVSDLDDQPGLEIFVANDMRPNNFWIQQREVPSELNDSQVRFQDVATINGCAVSIKGDANACMGVAFADFDSDHLSDLFVTNFYDEWANLFARQIEGGFRDVAARFHLDVASDELVGFGCQPVDYDNDGRIDLVVANGHIDDLSYKDIRFRMPSQLLVNRGDRFEVATQHKDSYWNSLHLGRCVVTCDYNRDGFVDVGISDLKDPFALLENETVSKGNWIQFRLVGDACERDAIGANIRISTGESVFHQTTAAGDGYAGRNEAIASFGLGDISNSVDVTIEWPNGSRSVYQQMRINARYLLVEGAMQPWKEVTY